MKMLRIDSTLDKTGETRSPLYQKIADGLFVRPVKIGKRAIAFPEHEVDAINAARVAGKDKAQIRALVDKLHEARRSAAQGWE